METKTKNIKVQKIWHALQDVKDPEIPVISVVDLGIITKVSIDENDHATVVMTPTFTGCPAIDVMKKNIQEAVKNAGFDSFEVKVNYDISWNSNMITDKGKKQLEQFGLGAPKHHMGEVDLEIVSEAKCPWCGSKDTTMNSPFGSALCRSIHFCFKCEQTFEKFKEV